MKHIEAVIFDLDGTLIDSMGYWSNVDKEYLSRRNIAVPDDMMTDLEHGNSFLEVAGYFKQKFGLQESLEDIIKEWTQIVGKHYEEDIPIKPGVRALLQMLKETDIKTAIGTSNSLLLAMKALKANKVTGLFDTIVTGCTGLRGKPHPDIFLQAAAELGVIPEGCIVCEDTLIGIQAAKRAGMFSVAVEDAYSEPDRERIREECDFYAKDFMQITKFIANLTGKSG